jgi:hypothetical protein
LSIGAGYDGAGRDPGVSILLINRIESNRLDSTGTSYVVGRKACVVIPPTIPEEEE